jgi:outer membrane protein assembly factor BamB
MLENRPVLAGAIAAAALVAVSLLLYAVLGPGGGSPGTTVAGGDSTTSVSEGSTTTTSLDSGTSTEGSTTTTTSPEDALNEWVDRSTVGQPWGDAVDGLITFRGNPTNTWYGTGPVPSAPSILWRYPDEPMCSRSTDLGVTSTWCGNGWTGQPVVWERPDGITEVIFGAYDRRLHFLNAETGQDTRTPFATGDIIKGSPTIDPDGYPLLYFGSRDNKLRILSLADEEAIELWHAVADLTVEGRWNDDWDASPRIVNDIMFEGCENGYFYIWKLNRGYDEEGNVTVDPVLLFKMETYTDELLDNIGPGYPAVSVEGSAALYEGRVYFANSGGRVIGLDITNIEQGEAPIVFDYWVGDDVDAAIVIDEEGMLYVSVEYERYLSRAQELGQLIKLDPYTDGDPYVWGMYSLVYPTDEDPEPKGGLWSTPALGDGVLYAVTNKGYLVVVDKDTGEEVWVDTVGAGSWSSPVIVDEHLLVATFEGTLRSYDISDPREPRLEWDLIVGAGHLEATPAIWRGTIYIGSRDGYFYAIDD